MCILRKTIFILMHRNNYKIQEIFKGLSLTENEIKIIESVLYKMDVKKGTTLLQAGDVVEDIYYIYEGCLRTFHIDKQGKEYTLQFALKDSWITDFTAFFSASEAISNIETLQNAIIYKLSAKDKVKLVDKVPQIQSYINKNLESAFSNIQKRVLANLSQTASEQYINFITTYPDIERNVKNYHIASYLGITTESLSRIRKELINS